MAECRVDYPDLVICACRCLGQPTVSRHAQEAARLFPTACKWLRKDRIVFFPLSMELQNLVKVPEIGTWQRASAEWRIGKFDCVGRSPAKILDLILVGRRSAMLTILGSLNEQLPEDIDDDHTIIIQRGRCFHETIVRDTEYGDTAVAKIECAWQVIALPRIMELSMA